MRTSRGKLSERTDERERKKSLNVQQRKFSSQAADSNSCLVCVCLEIYDFLLARSYDGYKFNGAEKMKCFAGRREDNETR